MNTTTLSQQTTLSQHGGIAGRRPPHYGHMQPMSLSCGSRTAALVKVPPWQCPSSAAVPPQGAPGGSFGRLGTRRKRATHSLGAQPLPRERVLEQAATEPPISTSCVTILSMAARRTLQLGMQPAGQDP